MQTARPVPLRIDVLDMLPLAGLFGTGRCGSTWVGACLGAHPELAYRFEPLHRRRVARPRGEAVLARLHAGRLRVEELPALYQALLPAAPDWVKPPFHAEGPRCRTQRGRAALWPLARRIAPAARLFRWLYTPRNTPRLLFKEVDCESAFVALAARSELPLLYLLRHPAAVVHSLVEGQQRGRMPHGRRDVLHSYLADRAPELLDLYRPDLGSHAAEALLWRANVERCVRAASGRAQVRLLFYEQLVREPEPAFDGMLRHLGLGLHAQVEAFLRDTREPRPGRGRAREIGIDPYFSVFRNGRARASRWQHELAREARREIAELVKPSPVFAMGSRLAGWDV